VRKALDIAFEGYTHPGRFLVLTTPFSFDAEFAQCSRNYFSDPDEWRAVFKVSGDDGKGLWRVVFPTQVDEADDEAVSEEAAQPACSFFPKAGAYPLVHRNIYKVHQRVAATFRKNRVFLAGDAAPREQSARRARAQFRNSRRDETRGAAWPCPARGGRPGDTRLLRPVPAAPECRVCKQQTIANKKHLEEKDPDLRTKNHHALRATVDDPVAHRAFLCVPPSSRLYANVRLPPSEAI